MTIGEDEMTGTPAAPASGGPTFEDVDLPVHPYYALRVAFGMLLGEDDLRVMMGNPRGKQMLHSSWLHGRGVVWGLRVERRGDQFVVHPGMAIDGHGRELHLDGPYCRSVREWAEEWRRESPEDRTTDGKAPDRTTTNAKTTRAEAWVVAEFAGCFDRPVPALADPCDVTRKTTEDSRIVEAMRITIRRQRPGWPRGYHRVRALLGLEDLLDGDDDVRSALEEVAAVEPHERAAVLLGHFRVLAARDATDLTPQLGPGDVPPGRFPVPDDDAGVVLARLTMDVTDHGDCVTVGSVQVETDVRTALLPTATIQELTCGRASDVTRGPVEGDGPRLRNGSVEWSGDRRQVRFAVTAPLLEGSQESGIEVSSLSEDGRGWAPSHVDSATLEYGGEGVLIQLDQAPAYRTVRLVIRGTGPTPLYGREPLVPFAGVEGGPPGSTVDGHDAVDVQQLYAAEREDGERT